LDLTPATAHRRDAEFAEAFAENSKYGLLRVFAPSRLPFIANVLSESLSVPLRLCGVLLLN